MKLTVTIQKQENGVKNTRPEDKYKYANIIDPMGGEAPNAFENYKRAKEEFVAMLDADREWREAIQQELDRALSDYFDKR